MLIDFIQCDSESFMPCLDIAGKSKIFSIIVDTLETAKGVLEINKEIKGGVINIFPLESIDAKSKPASRQIPAGVKSLLDVIHLKGGSDSRISSLIDKIFSKIVLVKTYDEGMTVAKDHNLTCITADLQVIYAGAFITKVGHYNRSQIDRFSLYQ